MCKDFGLYVSVDIRKGPNPAPNPAQINPAHTLQPYLPKIHFPIKACTNQK